MDHDYEGSPRADTAPMHDILQDALDDLVSNRSSTESKGEALLAIEHVLAQTSDPRAVGLPDYFNALQDTFQCNISSRIISWTVSASAMLDRTLSKAASDGENKADADTLSAQLAQAMAILQGVALVHKPSKLFLGRRYSLQTLLDLLLVSRHLTPLPTSSSTPTSPKSGSSSTLPLNSQSHDIPLASIVLDTLLCILVDSIPALRAFEDLNGVQVVVKILKRAGTPREVRMKCLEFLYFYLLDETTTPESVNNGAASYLSPPEVLHARISSPSHGLHPSRDLNPESGSSRSSSTSSAFSVLSTSTTATSISLHNTRSPTKSDTAGTAPNDTTSVPQSIIPGFPRPTRNITPPARNASVLGRGQPRSLLMLKNEVDYVPMSPKKPRLSQLGRAPSGLRPKLVERGNVAAKAQPRDSDNGLLSLSEDKEGDRSNSETSAGTAGIRTATPWTRPSTPSRTHSRGQSVSSVSSVLSSSSSVAPPLPVGRTPETPRPLQKLRPTLPPVPKLHRRAQSLADFATESPGQRAAPFAEGISLPTAAAAGGMGGGLRSASSPTAGGNGGVGGYRRARTMEEKKEILGTMLGNVDALVEGVKKAGVWGLS